MISGRRIPIRLVEDILVKYSVGDGAQERSD